MAKEPFDDLFEEEEEPEEEAELRPKPVEDVIKRILTLKPNMTRETVLKLIDEERARAAGLLTEEAATHLVASNLGTKGVDTLFDEETPESGPPATSEDASTEGEAPAPGEKESWFGEPIEGEEPTEVEPTEPTEGGLDWFTEAEEEVKPEVTPEVAPEVAEEGAEWEIEEKEEETTEIPERVEGEIISVQASPIVIPAVTPEYMKGQMKLFQRMKASLLDRDQDIATIQGQPYVKRSGWRKFALAFNLSDEIVREVKDVIGNNFTWRIWVRAWAPNGRSVVGIGACSSEERSFAHLQHDVYATAHTRAKNRALSDLIGSGEVSWEEIKGFEYS